MEESVGMELTLEDIFRMLLKRWWLIVGCVMIGMVACGIYTYRSYVPMYSTYTTVLVNRQDVSVGLSSSSDFYIREDLLQTFQGIINSTNLREQVASRLGTESLGSITVSADDSSIIRISVRHLDPELGAQVANTVALVFQDMIKEMMYDMDSSILDVAKVSYAPQGMGLTTKVMIGAILGGMISVGLIFVMEYLDKTFKTPKEVSTALDLPVMGVIPDIFAK